MLLQTVEGVEEGEEQDRDQEEADPLLPAAVLSSLLFRNGEGKEDDGRFWKRLGLPLVLLFALFTSFYRLEQYLYTVSDYEVANGLSAIQVLEGDREYH